MNQLQNSSNFIGNTVSILEIDISGENLQLHHAGVLYWPEHKMLVVADLHLEKGSSYARTGTFLPPYDSLATLNRLDTLIREFNPDRVIALGDSFHDKNAADRLPKECLELIHQMQEGLDWIWITGNHDSTIPKFARGESTEELKVGRLTFRHEPKQGRVHGEVAAHLHPCAKIRRSGRTIRRFCFVTDGLRLVMPAFGSFTGGLNVLDKTWHPYFNTNDYKVLIMGNDKLYSMPAAGLVPD